MRDPNRLTRVRAAGRVLALTEVVWLFSASEG